MRRFVAFVVLAMLLAACAPATQVASAPVSTSPAPTATAPSITTAPAPSGDFSGEFDIGGYSLYLDCEGSGSPTVLLEAGLGSGPFIWNGVRKQLAPTTRVCFYARAGISASDPRPRGTFTKEGVSAGFMAGETWKLLQAAGLNGPFVVVGHSYGGMLVRLFAFAHPDQTVGVVLVDSSSARQFEGGVLGNDGDWTDGPMIVNKSASVAELDAITSLGSVPLVVLTQSELSGEFEVDWSHFQDELATLSSNSLHMVAYPSGHMIMTDQEALVVESIKAVLESAKANAPLPGCEPRFSAVHALCLKTTMTGQLDAWTAERAAIKPTAGTFPAGSYRETLTAADFTAVTGSTADFKEIVNDWAYAEGRWTVSVVVDDGAPERHEGIYSAGGDVLTLVIPTDWKTPMTSGIYQLRWTKDADGTIHFEQVDQWPREPDWAVPYERIGPAG